MALQSSGQITLKDIADEFGDGSPHELSDFYRGGAHVGSANTNVPTSGEIQLSDFYGASAFSVALTGASSQYTGTSGTLSSPTEDSNRIVLVAYASRYGNYPQLKINGSTMSMVGGGGGIGQERHSLHYLNVPTGTSIPITVSSTDGGSSIAWSACSFNVPDSSYIATSGTYTTAGGISQTVSTTADFSIVAAGFSAYGSMSLSNYSQLTTLSNNTRGFGGYTRVGLANSSSVGIYGSGYDVTRANWV